MFKTLNYLIGITNTEKNIFPLEISKKKSQNFGKFLAHIENNFYAKICRLYR